MLPGLEPLPEGDEWEQLAKQLREQADVERARQRTQAQL